MSVQPSRIGLRDAIAERGQQESALGRRRWVLERTFAWPKRNRRLIIRYERRADIHRRTRRYSMRLRPPLGRAGGAGNKSSIYFLFSSLRSCLAIGVMYRIPSRCPLMLSRLISFCFWL